MPSLIDLGTLTDLAELSTELQRRIEARGFLSPRAFLSVAEQILVDHPASRALVLPDGTIIDGDLDLDYAGLLEHGIATVAVLGDLDVRGRIVNEDGDGGPFFIVDGNVSTREILKGGCSFAIFGSVRSDGVIFCDYNHGRFLTGGDIMAPVIVTNNQIIEAGGRIDGLLIGDEQGNMRELLVPDVFEDPDDLEDEWPDGDLIRERLAAGLPILKVA